MISQELLQKYVNSFILFEIANHGINPRETLDGTTLRIEKDEGYKYTVVSNWKQLREKAANGGLSYSEAIIRIYPGINLVDPHFPIEKLRAPDFEKIAKELFEGNDDQTVFNRIVTAIGGTYDMVAFLFFLKNSEVYMPIRSENFDRRFSYLQIDSKLSGNCTWEKYHQYNKWISEIHAYLREHVNPDS